MEEKYGIHFTEEILTAPGFGPLTREVVDTVQSVLDMNDPVGIAAGYYTDRLPIVCASRFFVEMLGYERERLGQEPGLKLEDIICTTLRYPFETKKPNAASYHEKSVPMPPQTEHKSENPHKIPHGGCFVRLAANSVVKTS